ncbi:hypothetical protein [Flavisolibacter ginsenosidimutans]|uniref:Uncharacterized protein n=1 Tax=Flavisolibacter ginsenosidimutans TaxID=661481 RepID=A0A5B8UMW3_9BACT|nr:hypothetical protein [Flavisolibacter ginsenosidimutans]QEC57984.1 hypothetical protein FSB75_19415 [Flavisolibacter ginsenosidimutans]
MGLHVPFTFRSKPSVCVIYIDIATTPSFIFIDLKDEELIREFGEEITIKTDFNGRLPKQDDYPALVELRDAIFTSLKALPAFITKRTLLTV